MKIERRCICISAHYAVRRRHPLRRRYLLRRCCLSHWRPNKNKEKNLLMTAPRLEPRRRHFRSPLSAATLGCHSWSPILVANLDRQSWSPLSAASLGRHSRLPYLQQKESKCLFFLLEKKKEIKVTVCKWFCCGVVHAHHSS